MELDKDVERLTGILLSGDRAAARIFVDETINDGLDAERFLTEVVAKAGDLIDRVYREDRATMVVVSAAVRLLRLVAARIAEHAQRPPAQNRTIAIYCGPGDTEELSAEIMAWLLEFDGHTVTFGGGGVPADEIQAEVARNTPEVLLLYASSPADAPGIRLLIDSIRDQDACPEMQIAVGGGIFDRAPGLAEEIGADLWGMDSADLRLGLVDDADRRAIPEQRTVGRLRCNSGRAAA